MSLLRRYVLRANALFLAVASISALQADVLGVAFGLGPLGPVFAAVPHAAIGFVEAHGLALIVGVLLWRAAPAPAWHATALSVHTLLGGANLAFWPLFGAAGMVGVGVVTTVLHGLFALLQAYALYEAFYLRAPAPPVAAGCA
jgi:hypothetical protein